MFCKVTEIDGFTRKNSLLGIQCIEFLKGILANKSLKRGGVLYLETPVLLDLEENILEVLEEPTLGLDLLLEERNSYQSQRSRSRRRN